MCALFVITGCLWIGQPGLQNDETLFTGPLYPPVSMMHGLRAFGNTIPLMVMSYVGAVKSLLYVGIFWVWAPSAASIRIPVLLAGAASIWLFYVFLRRIAGDGVALITAALLATDVIYLWTVRLDWGPVALQHFFLAAGLASISARRIGLAFFLFGLGVWDKAIFLWILAAVCAASVLIFPRQLWRELTWRRAIVAVLAFAAGAFPLIRYNVVSRGGTFRGSARFAADRMEAKRGVMLATIRGHGMFGWAIHEDSPLSREPSAALERGVVSLSRLTGKPRHGWMLPAMLLSLFGLFTSARRLILWALFVAAIAWLQMALNRDTGESLHHTILLWPFPLICVAAALDRLPRRWPLVATAFLAATNLLVTNTAYAQLIRNGGTANWSDAIYTLSREMEGASAPRVILTDWGYGNTLRVLNRGSLPLIFAPAPFVRDEMSADDVRLAEWLLANPQDLFISHTDEFQEFAGVNQRLAKFAAAKGYERHLLRTIRDAHGRAIFEVFRFETKRK